MKAYTIIDKNERNAQSECVLYTFKELKELFKPEEEEAVTNWEEWEQLQRMNEYLYSNELKEELLNN